MNASLLQLRGKVERSGNVAIITLSGGKRDAENMLAEELEGEIVGREECHLLLDFTHVESISSVELGTLIGLHKKYQAGGGRLTLFNLSEQIYEVFTVTQLHTLLAICREGIVPPSLDRIRGREEQPAPTSGRKNVAASL